ncbi:hypothetical protein H6F32_04920 [Anabaena sp. FACHB-1237]|uniref:hypothetical protein n=1 Tax=Anabaena sp. FACHB-1237 TaxID=2692769 RepID=UPI0016808A37|nr:hypothetical protein [Anabaena sp. FACHB-1237]MBD2136944.1 hypothetical protein [Anabaena sp. FACHB-1237]
MDKPTPKPVIKHDKESVLARPQKKSDQTNVPNLKEAFDLQTLQKNPWGQFLLFIEDCYKDFTPRPKEELQKRAKMIQNGIKLLNENYQDSWAELLSKIPPAERIEVDEVYRHISRTKKLTPQEVYQESQAAIRGLINNAEYGFLDTENRDIGRISQLSDTINYFQNHQSKTYLILFQLPGVVSEDAQAMFTASRGFQEIIDAGPSRKLQDFGMALMKRFQVTHTAIKAEAASNLVISIGEIERNLKNQIHTLEQQKLELEEQLQQQRNQGKQKALIEIATSLQNGRQPALDQMQQMMKILESQIEENGEPALSSEQSLSVFIILRNIMKVLQELGIETYPKSLTKPLEISQKQLSEYAYIEGKSFVNQQEIKKVECIQQGWKVGETIITPAKIRELNT